VAVPDFLKKRFGHFPTASESTHGLSPMPEHYILSIGPMPGKTRAGRKSPLNHV
jgi:hypothetical protein